MSRIIHLYNASDIQARDFAYIVKSLKTMYGIPVTYSAISLNLKDTYDISREQYNSTAILAKILNVFDTKDNKSIVIVDVDLFIPVLTYVFGEAQLDGSAAVVSTHRLKNQHYGLPTNNRLMLDRLEKEIVHELGHTFGLIHCPDYECVMRSSTYVEEIDLKNTTFCYECGLQLSKIINSRK